MGYVLQNIEDVYRQQPNTMCIPRMEQRYYLPQGETVLLSFFPEEQTEEQEQPAEADNVWVRVDVMRGERGEGKYIGVLLEKPPNIPNLDVGYRVEFGAEHVADIYIDESDYRWFDGTKLAMVSRQVIDENAWPGRVMRIPPADDRYSGWLILKGDEDRFFMRDFENFHSFSLEDCVSRCAVLASVLYEPIGADYKWDAEHSEYRK
jgi:hypothetical protein